MLYSTTSLLTEEAHSSCNSNAQSYTYNSKNNYLAEYNFPDLLEKVQSKQSEIMKHPFLDNALTPNWSLLTPEQAKIDIEYALSEAEKKVQSISNQDLDTLTYNSTLLALDLANEDLENAWGKVGHLDSIANSPELRKIYNELLPKVSEYFTKIYLNEKLWKVIKTFSDSTEAKKLSGVRKRFLEEVVTDFKENGADLDQANKLRLEKIETELAQLTQKFSENVLDATNAWELIIDNEADLAGLPESAKEDAKDSALKKNYGTTEQPKWRFTLQAPSMLPVMQYLDNDSIREKMWRANNLVGSTPPHDNSEIIVQILKLRQEKAELLGYKNFADFILKRRMAKSGAKALHFIQDLHNKVETPFKKEIQDLETYKAEKTGKPVEKLQPWEFAYWAEKRRKELYDFDQEELRPYFPIDQVINGMFQITGQLFNIDIKEKRDAPSWNSDVKYYQIYEKNGRLLGAFYADWFPRENKRSGAWMNHLLTGAQGEPHLGLICGNLNRPTKEKPALLTHLDVETIFHEFGHLLHHILGDVEIKSLHGTNVAWDFVELPSQILENWAWERESLNLFAKHYLTHEPIPEDLFKKMLSARNYLCGLSTMRQLSIAKMDLGLHTQFQSSNKNLDEFIDETLIGYLPEYKTKPKTLVRQLGHVFSDPTGYAAGYYSYKWAEVLDADAFTRFKKEGILNPEVGLDFREKILSKGNTSPAEELFHSFMGREPNLDALLIRCGLKI